MDHFSRKCTNNWNKEAGCWYEPVKCSPPFYLSVLLHFWSWVTRHGFIRQTFTNQKNFGFAAIALNKMISVTAFLFYNDLRRSDSWRSGFVFIGTVVNWKLRIVTLINTINRGFIKSVSLSPYHGRGLKSSGLTSERGKCLHKMSFGANKELLRKCAHNRNRWRVRACIKL